MGKTPTNPYFHKHTIYSPAPQLLLEKIVELRKSIYLAEQSGADPKSIEFYRSVLNTMMYAHSYMIDVEWVMRRAQITQTENEFLKEYVHEINFRLQKYEGVKTAIVENNFSEVVKRCEDYIKKYENDFTQSK